MVKKNILGRKLGRDMWKSRMQFVAVILLCALGSWCFSGLDALWRTIDLSANTYFEEGSVADLWVNMSVDREVLETLRNLPDVEEVQARFSTQVKADLAHEPVLQLEAYDGAMRINMPRMVSGEALDPSDLRGCLLDDGFAQANGLKAGDKLTLKTDAGNYDFWIRGTCQSAEYLSDNKDTTYDPLNYGFVLLSARALPGMPLNQATIILKDRSRSDAVEAAISAKYPAALIVNRDTQRSTSAVQSDVTMFHNLCYLFPLMAFAVAAMIVLTTITRMMENQRLQMGTLKALGFPGRQIRNHYMYYALYPSLIGSLLGLFVGRHTLPSILWKLEMAHFQFPYRLNAPVSWSQWLVTGLGVALAMGICYRTYRQSGRESTAQLLRPKPPKAGRKLLLERFPKLWSRMGFNAKMVTRNLMRNKGRSITSLVGVLCCTMLIITSTGLQESVAYSVGLYYKGTLAYSARANLTGSVGTAESYEKRIDAQRVETVMDKTVSIRTAEKSRTTTLTVLQDDQQLLLLGPDNVWMPLPETGVVLSQKLAQYLNAGVGDAVRLWLAGDDEAIVTTVSAIAPIDIGLMAFMGRSQWEGFRKGEFTPSAILLLNPTERGIETVDALDELDSWEYPEQQYLDTMTVLDAVTGVFKLMFFIALGLAFVMLYNMGILNFMERSREYATLKVLGYHQKEIRRLITSENDLLTGLGVLLGIGPGFWLTGAILESCASKTMQFVPYVSWKAVLIGCVVTYAFSFFVTRFLARKVRGIDMVAALKSVE